jgi:hypothetical protein
VSWTLRAAGFDIGPDEIETHPSITLRPASAVSASVRPVA